MNILFVCLGNICRSPMAAGIMKELFSERAIQGIVDSAGVRDWNEGSGADPRAVRVAGRAGIDIRAHRARQIRPDDFRRFQLIVVVDSLVERDVRGQAPPEVQQKIRRLAEADLEDPYHRDEEFYTHTFGRIEEGCLKILEDFHL